MPYGTIIDLAVRHAAITSAFIRDCGNIIIVTGCRAAHPEQQGMRHGSVKTLVESRNSSGNKFHLGTGDGSMET